MSVYSQLPCAQTIVRERTSAGGRSGWWPRGRRGAVGNWPDPMGPS